MDKDKLIVKQQLEIEDLKKRLSEMKKAEDDVHSILFRIGAPLNDNCDGYSHKQLQPFIEIARKMGF